MKVLLAIVITGAGTYWMRALFILLLAKREFPAVARRVLEYVAPAVMAALVVSMLVGGEGLGQLNWPAALGMVTAVATAAITRNHVITLIGAMAVYWGLGALAA
ncbi:MAG: AzlD domain-containing protein [Pseudomonadota bacterium]